MGDDETLAIGETATRFGVAVSALRYYDELGLVAPAERGGGGRRYGRGQLERLALVQLLQGGQLSLQEIVEVLAGPDDGRGWHEILDERIDTLAGQIEAATQAKALLEHFLTCPSRNPVTDCSYLAEHLRETVDERVART